MKVQKRKSRFVKITIIIPKYTFDVHEVIIELSGKYLRRNFGAQVHTVIGCRCLHGNTIQLIRY
jgi:hypothetical protein